MEVVQRRYHVSCVHAFAADRAVQGHSVAGEGTARGAGGDQVTKARRRFGTFEAAGAHGA